MPTPTSHGPGQRGQVGGHDEQQRWPAPGAGAGAAGLVSSRRPRRRSSADSAGGELVGVLGGDAAPGVRASSPATVIPGAARPAPAVAARRVALAGRAAHQVPVPGLGPSSSAVGPERRRSPRRASRATRSASATVDGRCATTSAVVSASTRRSASAHLRLGVHVQRGQRVVEDQHRRPGQDGPGQRHPLPLAAGQRHALLADPGVQAPGQVVHEAGLGRGQRRLDRPRRWRPGAPKLTFSLTLAENRVGSSNAQPTRAAAPAAAVAGRRCRPGGPRRTVTSASRGTRCSSVVLPDPVAPASARVCPGSSSRLTSRRTGRLAHPGSGTRRGRSTSRAGARLAAGAGDRRRSAAGPACTGPGSVMAGSVSRIS